MLIDFTAVAIIIGRRPDRATRLFLWRLMRRGAFPAALKVSEARIAWSRTEVEEWIASRPRVNYAGGYKGNEIGWSEQ